LTVTSEGKLQNGFGSGASSEKIALEVRRIEIYSDWISAEKLKKK
jgi:hypothetical protein